MPVYTQLSLVYYLPVRGIFIKFSNLPTTNDVIISPVILT